MLREGDYFSRNIHHGHFNQAVYDSFDVACLAPDSKLVVRRSTSLKDSVDVPNLFARAQVVNNIVNEIQQFTDEITNWHFLSLAEINHLTIKTITHRTPLVLLDQHFVMEPKGQVLIE